MPLMLRFALLLLAGAPACAPGPVAPNLACRRPLEKPARPDGDALAALAGKYEVILVNADGEYGDSVVPGTLTLWANDSARRYAYVTPHIGRLRGERPLAGAFDSRSPTVPNYPNRWEPGGPDSPVVELIAQTLYFGGIDANDGTGERLQITQVGPSGFIGIWRHSAGIEVTIDKASGRMLREPSGYFCAIRQIEG
jgi:hypothetical protein